MRTFIGFVVAIAALGLFNVKITAQSDHFAAMGFLPNGAGMRMVGSGATFNVDVYIESYSSDDEAKRLAGILRGGGSDALQKELEDMKEIGRIQLTGKVGFFTFKLIRQRPIEGGRRIVAVTDRPISGLEAYYGGRSMDYTYGILIMDLKKDKKGKEKGEGSLIYAGKVKVIDGKTVEIETYGISPVQLKNLRKL